MTSVIDLQFPEEIYDNLKVRVSELIDKIVENENILEVENVSEKINESKQILKFQQAEIESEIDKLKSNAEWEYFTIAFFGETNAGKSTLIETLRILFAEQSKMEIQAKFNQIKDEFSLNEVEYEQLKEDEIGIEQQLLEQNQLFIDIEQLYTDKINDYQLALRNISLKNNEILLQYNVEYQNKLAHLNDQSERLQKLIIDKKRSMSWWLKIIYIFKRLEEEKLLGDVEDEIKQLDTKFKTEVEILQKEIESEYQNKKSHLKEMEKAHDLKKDEQLIVISEVNQKQLEIKQKITHFEKILQELAVYEDGQIIGDGRSDYTRDSTAFLFNLGEVKVKLIDVPGIEGNEALVESEISNAVKKAHAVFYVTSKDAAPNEGTLEKIKKHLAAQTEVWTIYNKPVTSPRVLKGELIKSDDEKAALNDLNNLMSQALGEHYKNYSVIAGLAAFYAVAKCLVPFSEKSRGQAKFLDTFGLAELNEKSGLKSFKDHLVNDVVGDVEYKIKASNFNKANYLLLKTTDKLKQIHDEFSLLKTNIDRLIIVTKQEVESDYLDLNQNLKNTIANILDRFERSTRQNVYDKIATNISNDQFKAILKAEIDCNLKVVEDELIKSFKEQTKSFDRSLQDKLEKLSSRLISLQNNFKEERVKGFGESFDLKFDIDSGIKKMGLLGVGIGAAVAMWWNPVGWGAIALTAAGLIFSFAKAIWSLIDSNYKKSEQKKSTGENLSNILKELKRTAKENLIEVDEKLGPALLDLKIQLNQPGEQISNLVEDIQQSIQLFEQLSQNISNSYGAK